MSAIFVPVDGFRTNLAVLSISTTLGLKASDAATLCAALGSNYTWLTLRNVWGFEIVKATCAGGVVSIERGAKPLGGDVCIAFEWTSNAISDMMAQGGASPAVCDVKAGSDRVSVAKDGCTFTVDRPACDEVSFRAGNAIVTQGEGGCLLKADVAAGVALRAGTYKNATITVDEAGNIVAIEQGDNIVHTGGGCCTCTGDAGAA